MIELTSIEDAGKLVESSHSRPVLLLKHSTMCGTSAYVSDQFTAFVDEHRDAPVTFARVLVIEQRPVSQWLAKALNVEHASPQAILIVEGKAVWNASHFGITVAKLEAALADAQRNAENGR